MLGFFIQYPKGKYIGCEPNTETFDELLILKQNISDYLGYEIDCELYNEMVEDFYVKDFNKYIDQIDFTFTSIPYYTLETYSIDIVGNNYTSFENWKEKFISVFYNFPNCYINLPKDLNEKLKLEISDTYYLKNNVAKHLNKKEVEKLELIIKLKATN
jgi:hypothetical protein